MSEERSNHLYKAARTWLTFFGGISMTLLVGVLAGDLEYYRHGGVPVGWALLWIASTSVAVALGVSGLVLKSWRAVPVAERRNLVMGYWMVGMANTLTMCLHLSMGLLRLDGIWWSALVFGLAVLGAYIFLTYQVKRQEEVFP